MAVRKEIQLHQDFHYWNLGHRLENAFALEAFCNGGVVKFLHKCKFKKRDGCIFISTCSKVERDLGRKALCKSMKILHFHKLKLMEMYCHTWLLSFSFLVRKGISLTPSCLLFIFLSKACIQMIFFHLKFITPELQMKHRALNLFTYLCKV